MILIVDDKPENIFALKKLLEVHKFEVDTALSGEEALKKVLKNNYALIILDVQMPGMDGFEVAEAISGHGKAKDIPIIFLSAVSTDKHFITRGYSSGGIDYVAKPVDPDILLLKVKTFHRLYEQSCELSELHLQQILANDLLEIRVKERNAELITANKELVFQNEEKEKRAAELLIANKELAFQNIEKEKRAAELLIANNELIFQNREKEKRAAELIIANEELAFQNDEKEKLAAELTIANSKLIFQNGERERRAKELVVANEELAFQIGEKEKRTAELIIANNDILQRNKNLEQFSYIVSHNLRAPVANILGLTNILLTIEFDKPEGEKITEYLDIAAKKLDSVVRDINDILALKHNINEKKESVLFSKLVEEIESNIHDNINDEHIQIISDFSLADEISTIKSYLYSIFFNLISNSIKYRQNFIAPVIEITSARFKNKIQLIFKDNGLGMDITKYSSDVFGLYKRFHNHVDGKGMGLYMVKTQLETLGGTITIASEINKGTEFKIELETDN